MVSKPLREARVAARGAFGGWLMLMAAAGCARIDPSPRIEEALDLVERQTGQRPAWHAPWDDQPPAWDANSVLTLDQALALALRNNRELRAALEQIGQADAELVQAGLLRNPSLNFMMMFPSGGGRAMLRGSGLPMQPLEDLWLIPARQEAARAELQRAVLSVADRAAEIAAAVKKTYARLQYSQRALELMRENRNLVDQSTSIIRARQTAGRASQVDVNFSHIRSLKLKSELIQVEAEHRAAQRELLMLMGFAGAGDGWRVEPASESAAVLDAPPGEDLLLLAAAERRLDVKAAEWQAKAAAAELKLMRREALPETALGLGLERAPAPRSNNPGWAGRAGNVAARGLLDRATGMPSPIMLPEAFAPKMREIDWTLGPMIDLELPLFDQGQARIAQARHQYLRRRAEYEAKLQEVTRQVRETLVMYRRAYDQARFYGESIVPEVERNLQLARQAYVAGQEGLTLFLDVQEDLIMTRLKIVEYAREYRVQRAELERVIGGRLEVPDSAVPATRPADGAAAAPPPPAADTPAETVSLTCAMHPQIRRDAPGRCPICDMALTPASKPAK
ncbi:MAG: TolC family protein [Phycisphaerae bacterium]|jgi:cobalt-zinc-cadmium efflux system outer membrane protein